MNSNDREIQAAAGRSLTSPSNTEAAVGWTGSFPPQKRQISYEPVTTQHLISNSELDQLAEMRSGPVVELFWGFFGAFLGGITPALEKIPKVGNVADPLQFLDLVVIGICAISFVVMILMGVFWIRKENSTKTLISTIRDRKYFKPKPGSPS